MCRVPSFRRNPTLRSVVLKDKASWWGRTQVMSLKWEKTLTGSTVLRTCMEICVVWTVAGNWIVHEEGQYDRDVWRASYISYFRYRHVLLTHVYNIHFLGYRPLSIDGSTINLNLKINMRRFGHDSSVFFNNGNSFYHYVTSHIDKTNATDGMCRDQGYVCSVS